MIETTLSQRKMTHGDFEENARISYELKRILTTSVQFRAGMDVGQREALNMICHKIARIVSGDPIHADSWHDIAGYATLGERIAEKFSK